MQTSAVGLKLIKFYEGLRLTSYQCSAGIWTIGYGHTKNVTPTMRISESDAERLLVEDLKFFESVINTAVKVPMTQGIFDSLVSFTFNVGSSAFTNSTLLRLLNRGYYASAGDQLLRWDKVRGESLPGLRARREAERRVFYSHPFTK